MGKLKGARNKERARMKLVRACVGGCASACGEKRNKSARKGGSIEVPTPGGAARNVYPLPEPPSAVSMSPVTSVVVRLAALVPGDAKK